MSASESLSGKGMNEEQFVVMEAVERVRKPWSGAVPSYMVGILQAPPWKLEDRQYLTLCRLLFSYSFIYAYYKI